MVFKKNVLIVTGILAKPLVEKYVKQSKVKVEVLSLPIQVAAFITPKYAAKKIVEMVDLKKFGLILLPGLIVGDTGEVSKIVGVPTFKGPKHAADLPTILDNLDKISLSTQKPACELMQDLLKEKILEELNQLRMEALKLEKSGFGLVIGSGDRKVWTNWGFPPLLMAEIVNSPMLSDEEIQSLARYYVDCGADIVDVGMMVGGGNPKDAKRVVKTVLKAVNKPVSIDSHDVEEIRVAVEAGASLVLSIDGENMVEASKFPSIRKTSVVVTPADEDGKIPENYLERVFQLEKNIKKAKLLGFKNLIADPILNVQPFLESLLGYVEFRRRNPQIPVLFGAGNVTELIDADSVGINFLLALLAWEIGVNIIFTTQASNKTVGTIKEISTALKMVTLAKKRGISPKDLGLNLLVFKEKRRKDESLSEVERKTKILKVQGKNGYTHDPKGYFKVKVDRETGELLVFHYRYGENKPDFAVKGLNPKDVYIKIFEKGLVSRLDHAAYLGCELEKAKIALKTGRSYIQDEDIF
ncbi:MAG: hypothetical protein B6U77_00675 [Candidatus Hecatellales archaeon ex4484_218]|nr:MAG: hypothetical protein B6U77_00675 [Candidatus Hecatellales archaeon ex4484_218]